MRRTPAPPPVHSLCFCFCCLYSIPGGASASLGPKFCSLFHCTLSCSCLTHCARPMGANSHHLSQCACLPGHLPTPVSHYSFQVGRQAMVQGYIQAAAAQAEEQRNGSGAWINRVRNKAWKKAGGSCAATVPRSRLLARCCCRRRAAMLQSAAVLAQRGGVAGHGAGQAMLAEVLIDELQCTGEVQTCV